MQARWIYLLLCLMSSPTLATEQFHSEQQWGLGGFIRSTQVPYVTETKTDNTFTPMFFFQGEHFFLRGLEGGAHLYKNDSWQINLMGRMRFLDIPPEHQEGRQGYSMDMGVQWRKNWQENKFLDLEVFTDLDGRYYADIENAWYYKINRWELTPSVNARYKSADFNSQYFALNDVTNETIGAGVELSAKFATRFHVRSNFYLHASVAGTRLDNNAYNSAAIDQRWSSEVYLGFELANNINTPAKEKITNSDYLRIAHGWATPSNIGEIFVGDNEKDEYNNQLTSVFYGFGLVDELFNIPLDIYLTPGFVWHWQSEVQESEQEAVIAIKAYYTINWPVRWRLGIAEGISYVSKATYIEQKEMDEKGYTASKLLNYLDMTVDINLGDVFNQNAMKALWLGYSLHHRSAAFEKSSQFGRIKGGSNYNTVYLQFDF